MKPNDHQARHTFGEGAQNEMAIDFDFYKKILFSDKAHFWFNGSVYKYNMIFAFEVMIVHKPLLRCRYILKKLLLGVLNEHMESLVHISAKMKPFIMLQSMENVIES